MNTNLLTSIAIGIATIALSSTGYAQFKITHEDGIAASPKTRQMINEHRPTTPAVKPAMDCAQCVEVRSAKLPAQAKGSEIMTGAKQVSFSHGCASCDTQISVKSKGKEKQQVATHTCSMEVAANCCATK